MAVSPLVKTMVLFVTWQLIHTDWFSSVNPLWCHPSCFPLVNEWIWCHPSSFPLVNECICLVHREKKLLTMSDDFGRELTGVQNLRKKHKRLEAEITAHEPAIQVRKASNFLSFLWTNTADIKNRRGWKGWKWLFDVLCLLLVSCYLINIANLHHHFLLSMYFSFSTIDLSLYLYFWLLFKEVSLKILPPEYTFVDSRKIKGGRLSKVLLKL